MSPKRQAHSAATIYSLYRRFLRQSRHLPLRYLQQFFRIKARDGVRSVLRAEAGSSIRDRKYRRVSSELRQLEKANGGDTKAYAHILDLATGRTGKLRREVMTPLLSDPTAPLRPRIIPSVESSRPPVYSPELTALLLSPYSRTTKSLRKEHLITPPIVPERADPKSEEARLLGPFSLRRLVNIHWRYFTKEWKKVYPPLQVKVREGGPSSETAAPSAREEDLAGVRIRPVGLQDWGVVEALRELAATEWKEHALTRRQRRTLLERGENPPPVSLQNPSIPRFIRRRHLHLMGRLPELIYTYKAEMSQDPASATRSGRYSVSLPVQMTRNRFDRPIHVGESGLAWIRKAETRRTRPVRHTTLSVDIV